MSKALLAALALALTWPALSGCGGTGSSSDASAKARTSPVFYDSDDAPLRFFGHAASGAERRAIVAAVTRYYTLAAHGNGADACRILHALITETIVEEYGESSTLSGKSCAVIMSKLFAQHHAELALDDATLEVLAVRVEGPRALILVRFAKAREPDHIQVSREGQAWKIWDLLATHMP